MFNIFKKKDQSATEMTLKIKGMHCASCAMNIDDELEELDGVESSDTKYAQATTTVKYDPEKVDAKLFKEKIKGLGYAIETAATQEP